MILVKFLGNDLRKFEDMNEAVNAIEKTNVHPDFIRIFQGEFEEIKYEDLLKIAVDFELDKNRILLETDNIKNNIYQNIINKTKDNFIISSRVYYYGSCKDHVLLKAGINPVLVVSVSFGKVNVDFSTKKMRSVAVASVENEWEVVRVQEDSGPAEQFLYGNHPAVSYSIFITKKREKLGVRNES